MVKPGNYNERLVNPLPTNGTLRGADPDPTNWPVLKPQNNVIPHGTKAIYHTSNRTGLLYKYIKIDLGLITSGTRPSGCVGGGGDPAVSYTLEDFVCLGPAPGMVEHTGAAMGSSSGGGVVIIRRGTIKNFITGMDHPSNNPGSHGIYAQGSNGVFEYLYIENVNGRCFRTRNTSGSRNNAFRYIYCKDARAPSLLDGPSSPSGNIAHNVVLWNAAGLEVRDGSIVYKATVYGGATRRCVRTRDNGNIIRNSILLNCGGSPIVDEGTNSVISPNLVSGDASKIFNDHTKGDFSLKAGSSAINAGTSSSILGIICNGPCDQGAYEYGLSSWSTLTSNSQPLPLTPGSLQATAQ
jgi:hypothetical protein